MASSTWQRPWWLSFLDHTNITVTGLTAVVVLFTRSAGVAYFSAGALACSLSVKVLKRAIRQPRPKKSTGKKTYGMPSTHSATIAYYAAFISLACAYLPLHPTLPGGEALLRTGVRMLVIPWATLIALSRLWYVKRCALGGAHGL
ncbi:PAP2-domain-containing protein [Roridomyces roridus]|uniref:PAP2-domain-containing protein n=1 Tax=Roridomyces roridus TaxID=1738132 RepID=A0AAD7FMP5_9AGAR|nr:PAP2-domain-containing protein [Roridomyces roridus]